MKTLKLSFAVLLSSLMLLFLSSFTPLDKENIKVSKGKLKINNIQLTPDWNLDQFIKALGVPSKVRDGYNKTHTYHSKGLVLFEPMKDEKPSGKISEIQCYLSPAPQPNNVTPDGICIIPIKIDNLELSSTLSSSVMRAKLKKWQKTDSYIEHSYRMASKGLYIYFQFNDAEDQLIKISIGPDKNYKK